MTIEDSAPAPNRVFVQWRDAEPDAVARRTRARARFGLTFAGFIVATSLLALTIELSTSLTNSLASHKSIAEAFFLHFRYFTIQTNWLVLILLIVTTVQGCRRRPLPSASYYAAALVYIVVVGVTYEALLRRTGMRMDIFFFTDLIMHDAVPAFYLAFWLGFAPKRGLTWRDPVIWLAYPLGYFVVTMIAGALGQGYPYFFDDVATLGLKAVMMNTLVFTIIFYLLGLGALLLSHVTPRGLGSAVTVDECEASLRQSAAEM